MEQVLEKEIKDFQKDIGMTFFRRACGNIHKNLSAAWYILVSPFTDFF